jgi:hypothetical protein
MQQPRVICVARCCLAFRNESKSYCFDANDIQVILDACMENYPIQMWDANVHYLWTPNAN